MKNVDQQAGDIKKKSKVTRQDLIIVILIIIVLIPPVRKTISTFLVRLTLSKPKIENVSNQIPLSDSDLHWQFVDSASKSYTLKDFQGKRIFLNFWATWSVSSRAEILSIQKLYNAAKDSTVFILISFEEKDIVYDYLKNAGLNLPVYFSREKPMGKLQFQTLPTSYVITEDALILHKQSGAANYNSEELIRILNTPKKLQYVR
jgi:thiol-disulfide isomerase/thioredoxin